MPDTQPSQQSTQSHNPSTPTQLPINHMHPQGYKPTGPAPIKKAFKDVHAVNVYKVKEGIDKITHGLSFEHMTAPSNLELHLFYSSHSKIKLSYAYDLSARLKAMFSPYVTARPFTLKGVGGIEVRIQRKPVVSVKDGTQPISPQSRGSQSKQNTNQPELDRSTKNLITSHVQDFLSRGIHSPYLVLANIPDSYLPEACVILAEKLEAVSQKEEYGNPKNLHYAKSSKDFTIAGTPKGMLRIKKGETFSYRLDVGQEVFFLNLPMKNFMDIKIPFNVANMGWILECDPPAKTMLKPYMADLSKPS